jgi:hypothetical protein
VIHPDRDPDFSDPILAIPILAIPILAIPILAILILVMTTDIFKKKRVPKMPDSDILQSDPDLMLCVVESKVTRVSHTLSFCEGFLSRPTPSSKYHSSHRSVLNNGVITCDFNHA